MTEQAGVTVQADFRNGMTLKVLEACHRMANFPCRELPLTCPRRGDCILRNLGRIGLAR